MAGVTSVSDSETSNTAPKSIAKPESVKDGAESEGEEGEEGEGGGSEYEIEEVLDAKRGYFPEVRAAN